jgi:hypothetical protein
MAGTINLESFRGDNVEFDIPVVLNGSPEAITGWKLWFTAKLDKDDPDTSVVQIHSDGTETDGVIDMVNAALGLARGSILPAATETLSFEGDDVTLYCDVQGRSATGKVVTVSSGTWLLKKDITRSRT